MEFFKHQIISVDKIIPFAMNSRTHDDAQVTQLAASIREFGFTNPLLIDPDMNVIAGHGRLMAAKKLGMNEVPAVIVTGLDDRKRRALVIADNKLALNAGWDDEILKNELSDLAGDFGELMGFSQDELVAMLQPEQVDGLTDEDEVPEPPPEPITKLGDIWILGNHRLMCGDSTSIDAVDKLMDGQKADMVFTDPPYNVAMQRSASIKNDNLSAEDFEALLIGSFSCASANTKEDAPWFVWIGWRAWSVCEQILSSYKQIRNCIVWAKPSIGLGQPGYRYQHEIGLFCGSVDDRSVSDLWNFSRDHSGLHPTMKPVELVQHGLNTAGNKGDKVLDLFGGSGSTLIACEKLNRLCRMMELDPVYCDVIVKRWENFTGKKATHSETGEAFNG